MSPNFRLFRKSHEHFYCVDYLGDFRCGHTDRQLCSSQEPSQIRDISGGDHRSTVLESPGDRWRVIQRKIGNHKPKQNFFHNTKYTFVVRQQCDHKNTRLKSDKTFALESNFGNKPYHPPAQLLLTYYRDGQHHSILSARFIKTIKSIINIKEKVTKHFVNSR